MYYSASIFAALGYRNATAVGLLVALVNFGCTIVALRVSPFPNYASLTDHQIVDPFGRRRTMLYTIPIMTGALVLASIFFRREFSSCMMLSKSNVFRVDKTDWRYSTPRSPYTILANSSISCPHIHASLRRWLCARHRKYTMATRRIVPAGSQRSRNEHMYGCQLVSSPHLYSCCFSLE
jgi:hypothetical protein